jgi:hypothetical protein
MSQFTLNRRFLLKGLGCLAIPLPALEIMFRPSRAQARTRSRIAPPRRYIVAFAGATTGPIEAIAPTKVGFDYDLTPPLEPLANVKDAVSVISGLRIPPTGPGSWGGNGLLWHGSSLGPLMCGVACNGGVGPGTHGVATPEDVTSDQIVADAIGETTYRALHFRAQPQVYRENDGTYGVISMSRDASGRLTPNEPYYSPLSAWNAIFSSLDTGGESEEAKALRLQRASILDATLEQAKDLMKRLGTADKARLQNHLEAIYDLEKRINATASGDECEIPEMPPDDPPVFNPGGVGYAGENVRAELFTELIYTGLKCDIARVATMCYTFAQTFVDATELTGRPDLAQYGDAHGVGHFASNEGKGTIVAWHLKHFAALVEKLRDTDEPGDDDGTTMLDRSALVLQFESGWNAGDPHTGNNMLAIIAGGMKGNLPLKQGQHIVVDNLHPASVSLSAMNNALAKSPGEMPVSSLGEVDDVIEELF